MDSITVWRPVPVNAAGWCYGELPLPEAYLETTPPEAKREGFPDPWGAHSAQ